MLRLFMLSVVHGVFPAYVVYAAAEYVTDLAAYSLLAPCASSALSYNIGIQPYTASCGLGQEELQSCICSNNARLDEVTSSISSDISAGCGGIAASEEQSSASRVFKQYCTPGQEVKFSTPTRNKVNAYITNLSEMASLAPCASSGLSSAVMQESLSLCPVEASLLAPCVCSKSRILEEVSETISATVRSMCSNDEDVTSAYRFFEDYCAMNDGTTSFARPESPPGDMTYHITDLPDYTSLNSCARSGVSYAILEQTNFLCAAGPQALASCVCLKSGMRARVSLTLTSEVMMECDNTATDDVNSALGVLDFYCSAAASDVVAQVSVSSSTAQSATKSRTGQTASMPSETGDGQGSDDDSKSSGNGFNRTGAIVGGVIGGIVALLAIIGIGLFTALLSCMGTIGNLPRSLMGI
ncbi:hypothetical protein GMORB2_7833 [Geosmithia morbida]|uniref:Uncharacterized protein n=1 Tax=Geosmithia morbida TaxID=1094350 RepID=A0A9P5D3X6_9HYPO|nr:uncharacterized protein GMORB2_7833 [Geosmithia morbida]KAF4122240.1 hypothetical protein GMORB2_7833 [Geosmithia morbida]